MNRQYFHIAPLSFYQEKIIKYLSQLFDANVSIPDDIVHKDAYIGAYLEKANEILENIQQQRYDFQKSLPNYILDVNSRNNDWWTLN
ncbi:hypothetical protein [Pedobacter sp. GR22-6]|uniref:hypothetical protein n=1 Tax=Pedobacter sp. GR22-6 TaxID=3127957 RepID=UPI00307E7794